MTTPEELLVDIGKAHFDVIQRLLEIVHSSDFPVLREAEFHTELLEFILISRV